VNSLESTVFMPSNTEDHQLKRLEEGTAYEDHHEYAEDDPFIEKEAQIIYYVYQQEPAAQRNFLLKVYGILLTQILFTMAIICINILVPELIAFNRRYWTLPTVFMITAILLLFILYCGRRIFPINFILLWLFTAILSWAIGMISSQYYAFEVLLAASITAFIVVFLSVYVIITRANFNWLGIGITIALLCLVISTIVTLVMQLYFRIGRWWLMSLSGFGATIMSLFILYDTSMIIHYYTTEEVIPASIALYTDIISLYQYVLSFIGLARH
jgi:FtsH-binding integral membrane protein